MSRARRPTLEEKKELRKAGLVWKHWLIVSNDGQKMKVVNKGTGKARTVKI